MIDWGRLRDVLPAAGPARQKLRLWSGLVLFSFVLLHYLNHTLGIFSVEWMEAVQDVRRGFWRSWPGTILLYGAAITHISLGLWRIARRRTWRMPLWETLQVALVILIPYQLVAHVAATRGVATQFGIDDDYLYELSILWPSELYKQTLLLIVVWVHGSIGLHFWLRLRPWYRRAFPYLLTLGALVPAFAQWGWVDAARRLAITGRNTGALTPDQYAWLVDRISDGRWIAYALFAIAFLLPVARYLFNLRRPSVRITYPGRENIRALKGATLLEISRANGIAHASVCGGRARCSTCRTLIVEHTGDLPPPGEAELRVLKRIDADSRVRLACQLRPTGDMVVQPIMPAQDSLAVAGNRQDVYHWGIEKPAVIMFADMRNFTGMSEERLPYDVVFLLNRYLQLMSEAITGAGGQVDKFIGDGIMAIFGISEPIPVAARQAFQAAAAMAEALDRLNAESGLDAAHRIRIGIGLHAGPVILGRIGAAGAGAAPAAITALGDTVNAASRLETATKDFDVLLVASQNVLRAAGLSPEDGKHATIAVKGKRRSIDIVAIADPRALQAQLNEPAA